MQTHSEVNFTSPITTDDDQIYRISDSCIISTPAGYYVGTVAYHTAGELAGLVEPYSRDTEYMSLDWARMYLKEIQEDCEH